MLHRYKCLEFTTVKPRRSPWVRAFVDLHHPANGGWGRVSNAPDITSKQRYKFKSYKIRRIHQELRKYKGKTRVHVDLLAALNEYFEKLEYHKLYMAGAEAVCLHELVHKSVAERAPIPVVVVDAGVHDDDDEDTPFPDDSSRVSKEVEDSSVATPAASKEEVEVVVDAGVHGDDDEDTPFPDDSSRVSKEEVKDSSVATPAATKGEVEDSSVSTPTRLNDTPPTLSSKSTLKKSETNTSVVDHPSPGELPVAVTPSKSSSMERAPSVENSSSSQRDAIQKKRSELFQLLSLRLNGGSVSSDDAICKKIQAKIDELDEALLELIVESM